MKRLLSALLLVVVLNQVLPVNALAAIGKVLSQEELTAAYALTGYGDGLRTNAYHPGMMPNESWSASQISSYLEELLELNIHNLSDILSRVSCTLAENASAREAFEARKVSQRF